MKVLRFFVVTIGGGLGGSLCGAGLLGSLTFVFNYGDTSSSYLGPTSNLWMLMAMLGAAWGLVPGLTIGLVVGGTGCGKIVGLLLGAAIGMISSALFMVVFFRDLPSGAHQLQYLAFAIGPLPVGGLLGLAVAALGQCFRTRQSWTRSVVMQCV